MNQLKDLPPQDTQLTPQEEMIVNKFFGPPSQSEESRFSKINWKFLGASTLVFAVLANPWIDQLFCKVPYCADSPTMSLILKIVIFFVVLIILQMFVR